MIVHLLLRDFNNEFVDAFKNLYDAQDEMNRINEIEDKHTEPDGIAEPDYVYIKTIELA